MEDESRNEQDQNRGSKSSSESPFAAEITEAEHTDEIEVSTEAATKADKKKNPSRSLRERWSKTSLSNRLNVVLAGAIVLLTFVNVGFFVKQVMDQDKQVAQITRAITGGIDKANAAIDSSLSRSSEVLKAILEENRAALNATREQSKESLKETLAQGQKALNASIEASRADLRPWVGVITIAPPRFKDATGRESYIIENQPVRLEATASNAGKSPALKTHTLTSFHILPASDEFSPRYAVRDVKGEIALQPQMQITVFDQGTELPSQGVVAALKRGQYVLYFYGRIDYTDQVGRAHLTKWCMFLTPTLDSFLPCTTYNDAN